MDVESAIAIFKRRAADLQTELTRVSDLRQNQVVTANPGFDTGGIRSHSEKQRDAGMERVVLLANRGIDLQRQRDGYLARASNLIVWSGTVTAIQTRLESDEPLPRSHRSELKADLKYYQKKVSSLICDAIDLATRMGY